jgi:hypothetical protein
LGVLAARCPHKVVESVAHGTVHRTRLTTDAIEKQSDNLTRNLLTDVQAALTRWHMTTYINGVNL